MKININFNFFSTNISLLLFLLWIFYSTKGNFCQSAIYFNSILYIIFLLFLFILLLFFGDFYQQQQQQQLQQMQPKINAQLRIK